MGDRVLTGSYFDKTLYIGHDYKQIARSPLCATEMPVTKVLIALPDDTELLQAVGRVALAHNQLEHMLRMMYKSLSGLTVQQALDATNKAKSYELRETLKRLFKQSCSDERVRARFAALLGKADRLTEQRNTLLHRPWAKDAAGGLLVKDEGHKWGTPPTDTQLNSLADDIFNLVLELNQARLTGGFIHTALSKP